MLKEQNIKIKELRKLPCREWDKVSYYHSLLVINSGKKHESGYAWMDIIGCNESYQPVEIAASCDDIEWQMNGGSFRNDMHYPSGAIHFWSRYYNFCVGASLSTTSVALQQESTDGRIITMM